MLISKCTKTSLSDMSREKYPHPTYTLFFPLLLYIHNKYTNLYEKKSYFTLLIRGKSYFLPAAKKGSIF